MRHCNAQYGRCGRRADRAGRPRLEGGHRREPRRPRRLRCAGAKATERCSQHVHVGVGGWEPRQVANLARIFYKQEVLILKAAGTSERRLQTYTKPTDRAFIDRLEQMKPATERDLNVAWYGTYTPNAGHYHSSQYRSLNLNNLGTRHTVEFRFGDGTTHAGRVKTMVQLCLAIAAKALNARCATTKNPRAYSPESARYDCHVMMIRLGMIGPEFKTARQLMMRNLPGSGRPRRHLPPHPRVARKARPVRGRAHQHLLPLRDRLQVRVRTGAAGADLPDDARRRARPPWNALSRGLPGHLLGGREAEPDTQRIRQKEELKMKTGKVAVYGTLLAGEPNYQVGADAVGRTPCAITGTLYDTGYGFPAFVPQGTTEVKAELLEVDEATMERLDRLEGYPRLYGHRKMAVRLPDGQDDTAWVYMMNRLPDRAGVILSGDCANGARKEGDEAPA